MEEIREEKALRRFSSYALFAVTACSFVLFSLALKLLEGTHSPFFLKRGGVAGVIAIILRIRNRRLSKVGPYEKFDSIFQ
jgi:hypothetical protein